MKTLHEIAHDVITVSGMNYVAINKAIEYARKEAHPFSKVQQRAFVRTLPGTLVELLGKLKDTIRQNWLVIFQSRSRETMIP